MTNVMLAWQTFNALFVIRAVSKYLVEMVPEYELCRHLDFQAERRVGNGPVESRDDNTPSQETSPSPLASPATPEVPEGPTSPKLTGSESRVEMLIDALIGLIIDVPVTDNTYYLHLECINTMLVLMSVYMFAGVHGQTRLVDTSLIYRTLFQGRYGMHAPLLVKTLLNNLSSMLAAPPSMFGAHAGGGSLLINLASGLWNMITFNSTARQTIYTHPPLDRQELQERVKKEHPVANQSCLLLLTLANHCMNDDNLYRNALLCCEDTAETSAPTPQRESNGGSQVTPPRIDMAAIVPILQVLYNAPENNNHHIYMSLIVLLILTEDDALIKNVHLIMLKNLTWYTERAISEISLGGLMVLVVLRALHYNMVRVRDKYLHTNCLAAIANMSCEFRNLHPYVAQRLISLFETLTKRRARLCSEIEGGDINNLELPHITEEKTEEIMDHISVLDEVLRMLLEIINSCVSHQLASNCNVVYALLHKRHLFTQHTHHPVAQNIDMVIGYFSTRLQRVQEGAGGDLGVNEVLQCIKKGAEQWSSDRLKKFPDLKFRYVEEERPEEFFTPYVWSLVNSCGGVYWASEGGARALGDLLAC
ncbi:hypothetical protein HW555_005569 [Spodoptera exigua]|uniref:Dymeclin n=1 Tax=Spodoptera exigua TaxID=7107 RepID=A0A835GJH2_SPOEX|nr:hypothetical protein HW555_005569 [Spodoptera exigua]